MNQQLDIFGQDDYEGEAIDFLKMHEPPEGYLLAYSGGKDSDCLYHLAKLAKVKYRAIYSATGIDFPEVVKHIRLKKDVEFLYPKKSFIKLVREKGLPSVHRRWCCDCIKHSLSKKLEKIYSVTLVGVRAEESANRAKRGRVDIKAKKRKVIKPIFHWKEWQVWDFIERHKIEVCKLYDEGFDRIGCAVCPFICSSNQQQVERNRAKWPGIYKAFEHAAKRFFDTKGITDCTFEEFIDRWYHGENLYQKQDVKQLPIF